MNLIINEYYGAKYSPLYVSKTEHGHILLETYSHMTRFISES